LRKTYQNNNFTLGKGMLNSSRNSGKSCRISDWQRRGSLPEYLDNQRCP
jgi:hypothetical protein